MKTILVTGASRGIGLEFVRQLTQQNTFVHIFAGCRSPENATELKCIRDNDKRVHVLQLDVANDDSIQNVAKQVEAIVGSTGLNIIVNNAGVCLLDQEFGKTTREAMLEAYNINTIGNVMCVQAFHTLLHTAAAVNPSQPMSARRALVFNVSTDSASMGNFDPSEWVGLPYRCSKAALNMASKCMSIDLKNDNILTLAVHPGYVITDMTNGLGDMTAEECVQSLIKLIESVDASFNGRFVNWLGEDYAW